MNRTEQNDLAHRCWVPYFGMASGCLVVVLFVALLVVHGNALLDKPDSEKVFSIAFVFWAVAPPGWFLFEYWYHDKRCKASQTDLERVKTYQERAGALWLGIAAALLAILDSIR